MPTKRAHAVLRIANTRMRWTMGEASAFGIRCRSMDGKTRTGGDIRGIRESWWEHHLSDGH